MLSILDKSKGLSLWSFFPQIRGKKMFSVDKCTETILVETNIRHTSAICLISRQAGRHMNNKFIVLSKI